MSARCHSRQSRRTYPHRVRTHDRDEPRTAVNAESAGPPFRARTTRLELLLQQVMTSPRGRALVAASVHLTEEELALLATDEDAEVRRAVAANPLCPVEVINDLARQWTCRRPAASNPSAPPALLAELARDPDPSVRKAAAANPGTPATALARLSQDPDLGVRIRVAANPGAPEALLHLLVEDRSPSVRRNLAGNPSCPAAVLTRLRDCDDPVVQTRLCRQHDPTIEDTVRDHSDATPARPRSPGRDGYPKRGLDAAAGRALTAELRT